MIELLFILYSGTDNMYFTSCDLIIRFHIFTTKLEFLPNIFGSIMVFPVLVTDSKYIDSILETPSLVNDYIIFKPISVSKFE